MLYDINIQQSKININIDNEDEVELSNISSDEDNLFELKRKGCFELQ